MSINNPNITHVSTIVPNKLLINTDVMYSSLKYKKILLQNKSYNYATVAIFWFFKDLSNPNCQSRDHLNVFLRNRLIISFLCIASQSRGPVPLIWTLGLLYLGMREENLLWRLAAANELEKIYVKILIHFF